ncbi:partitioning defective 3 homolog, partial [Anneissia japonica]|uniref:partitioning defective 3 homolog n=1 Tax=Anneissia japonica TaxID=1529436 RepID=UPI00142554EB
YIIFLFFHEFSLNVSAYSYHTHSAIISNLNIQTSNYWITVHSVQSISDGGILDSDDLVVDVADDREKLLANFEEQDGPRPTHSIGDGTSASSAGTASPDMFHTEDIINTNNSNKSFNGCDVCDHDNHNQMDVVVTDEHINAGTTLHVRRGSEPVRTYSENNNSKHHREEERWGSGEILDELDKDAPSAFERLSKARSSFDGLDSNSAFSRFGRDSKRQSMTGTAINKFISTQQSNQSDDRTEPVGESSKSSSSAVEMETKVIDISNDGSPLGVHIVPFVENADGSAFGMVVHDIEPNGRAARDGRLRPGDHIIAIDAFPIFDESFDSAQDLMKEAMKVSSVSLKIEREKSEEDEEQNHPMTNGIDSDLPPEVPVRAPSTTLSTDPASPTRVKNIIAPTNTRRIGRKLYIQLMKGPQGLGFSVTTRDNSGAGNNPIYIKNILPKGAAIADGRLKAGDRLLEVNGIEMTGKSQVEAVSILRSVKLGGVVNLVVSRQESSPSKFLPRPIEEASNIDETVTKNKQILNFDIELNDTGSAGLGVSVKGKTAGTGSNGETKDLGIFIKSVIHGGAASKDGRLRPNDQLLCINAVSLLNKSNSEAMETLRKAMCAQQPPISKIRLIIARRTDALNDSVNETSLDTSLQSKSAESLNADRLIEVTNKDTDMHDSHMQRPLSPSQPDEIPPKKETNDQILAQPLYSTPLSKSVPNRSQSYQIATQATPKYVKNKYKETNFHTELIEDAPTLPTVTNGEVFLIEDTDLDLIPPVRSSYSSSVMPESQIQLRSQEQPPPRSPSPPQWVLDWAKGQSGTDDYEEEDDKSPGFTDFNRDSFARRSFSERKHGGSLDAQQLNWYNKTRSANKEKQDVYEAVGTRKREGNSSSGKMVKSNSSESLLAGTNLTSYHHTAYEDYYPKLKPKSKSFAFLSPSERKDLGPGLGMKKSSSFESLQAAVADYTNDSKGRSSRTSAKVIRGRVCNESFRAAVDRSYGDTLDRKDVKENGGLKMMAKSDGALDNGYIGDPSEKPMRSSKKKTKDRRKTGVLKGLGSMFRFGKNRKPGIDDKGDDEDDEDEKIKSDDEDRRKARYEAEDEQERIQEQHKKLRDQEAERKKEEGREAMSKAERMLQLREQHQQKHRERNGRYKDDEEDDDDDEYLEEYRGESIYSKPKQHYRENSVDDRGIYQEYRHRNHRDIEDSIYDTRREHMKNERPHRGKSYDPYDRYDETRYHENKRRSRPDNDGREMREPQYEERYRSSYRDDQYRRYNDEREDRYPPDGHTDERHKEYNYHEKEKRNGSARDERRYESWQRREKPYEQRYRDDAKIYDSRRSQNDEKTYDVPRYPDSQRDRNRGRFHEDDVYDRIGERKKSKEYSDNVRHSRDNYDEIKKKDERKKEVEEKGGEDKSEKVKKSFKDIDDKKLERVDSSKEKNGKKIERKESKEKLKRNKSLERKESKEKEKEEKKIKKLQRSESKEKMKKEKNEKSNDTEKVKQGRDKSKERLNEKSKDHKDVKKNGSVPEKSEKIYESYKRKDEKDNEIYETRRSHRDERNGDKSRHRSERSRYKEDDYGFHQDERRPHSKERSHHSRIRRASSPPDYGSLDRRKNGSPKKSQFHSTTHLENGPVHSRHRSYDQSYRRVERKEAIYSRDNHSNYSRPSATDIDYRGEYQRYRPHSPTSNHCVDYDQRWENRKPVPNYRDHYGYNNEYREYRSQPSSARQSPYPQYEDYDRETYEAARV